jgi:hypothetical protein
MNNATPTSDLHCSLHMVRGLLPTMIVLAMLLFTNSASAQYGPDDEAEALEALKPKVEEQVKLPPMPKQQDLVSVDTGPTARQAYTVDAKSLTVSPDHIVRYTVISTSSSGSQNVSYEGIDCKSNEFKRYAYGSKDGKWTYTRRDKWDHVSSMAQNQLHFTLARHFFCQAGLAVGKADELVERLRHNRALNF